MLWGWTVALLHTAIVTGWCVLLTEILLLHFRKIPFTCSYPPFHHSAIALFMIYVCGFFAFAVLTAELEYDAMSQPFLALFFLAFLLAACQILHRFRQEMIDVDRQLIFEDIPTTGFELLHLADGN